MTTNDELRAECDELTAKIEHLKSASCRRCMEWKRKDAEYGVCWLRAFEPQWVNQNDRCESFKAKVTRA